ncbi:copper resistance protein CopC [Amnibacterium sp. CER49]|uniref:copper resistance CopC family protein n=1 Tax=Amnibacterium sp. CER49 TaxID=3039161 RepID=UPI00244C0674|nr:copper resistance protein CopC [Amnibacterium sp. CER49]MDH2442486.1 copper resistance protein CopC [Amnibacterium sp. CER49]
MPLPDAPRRTRRWRLPAALALVAAVLLPAVPASAHDFPTGSSPKAGSTVTAPLKSVSVTFDEAVLTYGRGSTVLRVIGPEGRHFETACPTVTDRTVSVTTRLGGSGRYTVSWRVVSADGHPVTDSLAFTYRAPSGTAAAGGSTDGPACGAGTGAPRAASSSGTSGVVVLVAVVGGLLVLLVAAAVVVAVLLTRRRG